MPTLINQPTIIEAAGTVPKQIEEFVGKVNSGHSELSIARMKSPQGWLEPGQQPEFQEFTIVLRGTLVIEHKSGTLKVTAGQTVITNPGEWVRYSTPEEGGAEYLAVCLPAFSPDTVNRDPEK